MRHLSGLNNSQTKLAVLHQPDFLFMDLKPIRSILSGGMVMTYCNENPENPFSFAFEQTFPCQLLGMFKYVWPGMCSRRLRACCRSALPISPRIQLSGSAEK